MKLSSKTNWNLYRCFIATYEAGGYSQAVKHIDVARNNIKANVDTLSRQLGVDLFISNSKGVTPTSHAVKIYPVIKNAVESIIREEESLKDFTSESEAIIRMIIPATMVGTYLAEFFKDFQKKYPKVIFVLNNRAQEESYNEFSLGNVDIVIDIDEICKSHGLKTVELVTFNLVFIASKNYLAEKGLSDTMNKSQLQKLNIIGHPINIKSVIEETGWFFTPSIETKAFMPIYTHVKLGNGVGLYTKEYLKSQNDNSDVIEIKINDIEKLPKVKIGCVYNKKTISKATQIFIDELIEFCKKK